MGATSKDAFQGILFFRSSMASGKKNYFRHSTSAFEDPKIQKAIELLGYEGYAYYFILLELMAKQCENEVKETIMIHQQTLRIVWRKSQQSCHNVVTKLAESGLFVLTFNGSLYEFRIPNLSKYLGKYESKFQPNAPNEKKGNEKKTNESKNKKPKKPNAPVSPDALAVIESMNKILNSRYTASKSVMKFINARLSEGFVLNDFETVLVSKHREWSKNVEMAQHLTPSTLFGGKFEGYLNAAGNRVKTRDEKLLELFAEHNVEGYDNPNLTNIKADAP